MKVLLVIISGLFIMGFIAFCITTFLWLWGNTPVLYFKLMLSFGFVCGILWFIGNTLIDFINPQ